jgi:hypothetical protein
MPLEGVKTSYARLASPHERNLRRVECSSSVGCDLPIRVGERRQRSRCGPAGACENNLHRGFPNHVDSGASGLGNLLKHFYSLMTLGDALRAMDEIHCLYHPNEKRAPISLRPAFDTGGTAYRSVTVGGQVNMSERTVTFSCSSEAPVLQGDCWEILSHAKGALREERLDAGVVPFLLEHTPSLILGRITGHQLSDRKLYVRAKISRNDIGANYLRDAEDGIATQISVGYRRHSLRPTGERDGLMEYTVEDWQVVEVSAVACPADWTVGYGRSHQ